MNTSAVGSTRRNIIPVAGPSITELEIEYVNDAIKTAWYNDANKYHQQFESKFANYVGRKHALALPGCTSALHLSMLGLDIKPGDEVIVPDVTWIASAVPITYCGGTPVFVDIDRDTWCINVDAVAEAITDNTRAVITVDLYGSLPDYERLTRLCARRGIELIEDSAESIGASQNGRKAGSFGLASTFSFHGTKTMTTGEGGMLVTDDDEFFSRAQVLSDHGRPPGDRSFFHGEIAWKYKMSSLQAALGLAQIERIDELIAIKRKIFGWYNERLANRRDITLNHEPEGTINSYWMITAVVDSALGLTKQQMGERLSEVGITTRPFFYPLSSLPAFKTSDSLPAFTTSDNRRAFKTSDSLSAFKNAGRQGYKAAASPIDWSERNPNAYDISARGINLPSALDLTESEVDYVCKQFCVLLDQHQ